MMKGLALIWSEPTHKSTNAVMHLCAERKGERKALIEFVAWPKSKSTLPVLGKLN